VTEPQGLHTKTVGLHFQVQKTHFKRNVGKLLPRLEISCISTVGEKTRHKAVFPTLARALTSKKLAEEIFWNSAGKSVPLDVLIMFCK
jgi:hypothetical protein